MRRRRDENGSAIVEFTFLSVLFMVPLLYLLLTVFQVQRAAYAVTAATREAARAFVTADSESTAFDRAYAAAGISLADHDLGVHANALRIECTSGTACLSPGSQVTVALEVEVPLPFIPALWDGSFAAAGPVRATHVQVVDSYRSRS
jgi:Flp pilus assembly protein TadG